MQKQQKTVNKRLYYNLRRWVFYSSTYAKLFIHLALIGSLTIALISGLNHLETTKITESKIKTGGDLLISGVSWNHETLNDDILTITTVSKTFSYGYLEFIDDELMDDDGNLHVEIIGIPVDELSSIISYFHSSELPSEHELTELFESQNSILVYGENPVENLDTMTYLKAQNPSQFGQKYYTFPINFVGNKDIFPSSSLFKSESGLNIITSLDNIFAFEEASPFRMLRYQTVFLNDEATICQTEEELYYTFNNITNINIQSSLTASDLHSKSNSFYPIFDFLVVLSVVSALCLVMIGLNVLLSLIDITTNELVESISNPHNRSVSWKRKRLLYDQLVFTLFFVILTFFFHGSFLAYVFSLIMNTPIMITYFSFSLFSLFLLLTIYSASQILIFYSWHTGKKRADNSQLRKEEVF